MRHPSTEYAPETLSYAYLPSPLGLIAIGGTETAIRSVRFVDAPAFREQANALLKEALKQLAAYFTGRRLVFELPLGPQGTAFQQDVWQALQTIPFGRTAAYGEISRAVGRPRAARAVGQANRGNPIAVIVPCHRVIGQDGDLTGYGSGLWRKTWLLEHEQRVLTAGMAGGPAAA